MTEPSLDPNTDDGTDVKPDLRPTTGVSRWQKVVGGIGLVVVLWVGSETYDQVSATDPGGPVPGQESPGEPGPGGDHGPGQDTPSEPGQEIDTDDGGDHDPSQFDDG